MTQWDAHGGRKEIPKSFPLTHVYVMKWDFTKFKKYEFEIWWLRISHPVMSVGSNHPQSWTTGQVAGPGLLKFLLSWLSWSLISSPAKIYHVVSTIIQQKEPCLVRKDCNLGSHPSQQHQMLWLSGGWEWMTIYNKQPTWALMGWGQWKRKSSKGKWGRREWGTAWACFYLFIF